jgi:hypothetical protein
MYSSAYRGRDWPYGKSTGAPVCWPYARENGQARHEDGSGRVRKDEGLVHAKGKDQCWLYKEEEEEEFSGYISLSSHREGRTREEVTAGSLRSEKKGGETKLHTRKGMRIKKNSNWGIKIVLQ